MRVIEWKIGEVYNHDRMKERKRERKSEEMCARTNFLCGGIK